MAGALCSAGSLPPTLTFFSEVRMIIDSGLCSYLLLSLFLLYLFFGGIVPLFVLGASLSRHFRVSGLNFTMMGRVFCVFYLLVVCFMSFVVI